MASRPVLLVLSARGVEMAQHVGAEPLDLDDLLALQAAAAGIPGDDGPPAVAPLVREVRDRVRSGGTASLVPANPPATLPLEAVPQVERPPYRPGARLVTFLPRTVALTADGFAVHGPDGHRRALLSAIELRALAEFRTPLRAGDAHGHHVAALGVRALDADAFTELVDRLAGEGLLATAEGDAPGGPETGNHVRVREQGFARRKAMIAAGTELVRRPPTPGKVPVIALYDAAMPINLALGLLLSYAAGFEGGRLLDHYELLPVWVTSPRALQQRLERHGPAVVLFSNYVWSYDHNMALADRIKTWSPASVLVHGGPSTPKYEADADAFFAAHPGVDVAVRGEGEQTFVELLDALAGHLHPDGRDLAPLAEVAGLTFRTADGLVRTPDRARLAELDVLPSPYLEGMFDPLTEGGPEYISIETNRGCPYGCTFCDWGSATNSRIRKFDLQRVFDEIEWACRAGVENLFIVDANFGILARDVEIARKVVECHQRYGFPRSLSSCFAKNTIKHTADICTMLWEEGITFHPVIALQSTDPDVLDAVDRSNIKTEAYDALADHLRSLGATVGTELIMGLPGSTVESFSRDLQGCIDRELFATVYDTMVLPNAPMNAPEYRARHQLEIDEVSTIPGQTRRIIAASATFTRADRALMQQRRRQFRLLEDIGVLRQVARWVRHETGTREIDFYDRLGLDIVAEPDRAPLLAWMLDHAQFFVAPSSWVQVLGEVWTYLHQTYGLEPDTAMATVFRVQHLLIPDADRAFPATIDVAHDYAAWYRAIRSARAAGEVWERTVPHLRDHGPGTFTVEGSPWANDMIYGADVLADFSFFCELESPVMRGARLARRARVT